MKPLHAITVFGMLVLSMCVCSVHGYRMAERNIVNDMNQALSLTLKYKQEGWITPDTIHDYRKRLHIDALRETSIIYYALEHRQGGQHGISHGR